MPLAFRRQRTFLNLVLEICTVVAVAESRKLDPMQVRKDELEADQTWNTGTDSGSSWRSRLRDGRSTGSDRTFRTKEPFSGQWSSMPGELVPHVDPGAGSTLATPSFLIIHIQPVARCNHLCVGWLLVSCVGATFESAGVADRGHPISDLYVLCCTRVLQIVGIWPVSYTHLTLPTKRIV